jgi:hypothetical protein
MLLQRVLQGLDSRPTTPHKREVNCPVQELDTYALIGVGWLQIAKLNG